MEPEIRAAIAVACKRKDFRTQRIGCVIRRNDGVLVAFSNKIEKEQHPSHHAEARCARKATPDAVAYVVRVLKDGSLSMAHPCLSCRNRLKAKGVKIVVFSNWDGELEKLYL